MKTAASAAVLALIASACAPNERAASSDNASGGVVDVIARGLTFEAPDTIPSGWTTFRFRNESGVVHFAVLERLPDGMGLEEQQQEVAPVFQAGMDLLNAGKMDAALAKFGELPEWFGRIVFMGGPGLTGPGRTSAASVYLEPGTYLLECYVKTGGVFHSYNPEPSAYGMVHELTVTRTPSGAEEPVATARITLSSERGIEVNGELTAGEQTVAVHFEDQVIHENFVGHDVHLVRLTDETELAELAAWMDWRATRGLETPAPAEFVGGLHEMPAGATGYITVTLEPGRYAWIAEVPEPEKKGMLQTFEVAPGERAASDRFFHKVAQATAN